MELTDIMTFLNTGVITYTLFKIKQMHAAIDKITNSPSKVHQKKYEFPEETTSKSSLEFNIDYLDLEMTEEGWQRLSKNISSERGVYLHFGISKEGRYIPLRVGMTAAKLGFHNRWMGAHRQAFNAVKCNDYKYIKDYPNYAFFFDDMRDIFPKTFIVFVKLKYGREKILNVEKELINHFVPLWEELYVKRKWKVWKDDVYSNKSIHQFINEVYVKPRINDFSKESINNLVERIEKLIG